MPPPCCSLTLDGPTDNRQDDEWRCHTMASPPLREAQWRDDGSLAAAALGGAAAGQRGGQRADGAAEGATGAGTHGHGRVAAPALAGALYSLSTDRTLPTNRSLTPRRLQAAAPREP